MRERRLSILVAVGLVLVGAACVTARVVTRKETNLFAGDVLWRLTYDIVFRAPEAGTRIAVAIPDNTQRARIFQEKLTHPLLVVDVLRNKKTRDRNAVAVTLGRAENARFIAEFDIHVNSRTARGPRLNSEKLSTDARAQYLRPEKGIQVGSPKVKSLLAGFVENKKSKEDLIRRIFEYCYEKIASGSDTGPQDAASALERGEASSLGRARAMVALCRTAHIPARLVTGFVLEDKVRAQPQVWVEVFFGKRWLPYDPENGYSDEIPPTYIPVRRGHYDIVRTDREIDCRPAFAIERLSFASVLTSFQDGRLESVVDLLRLPPGMQETLALVLLLPLGALVTAICRNMIGIDTYGTLAPSLLALSFVHGDWRTGLMVLLVVILVGLGGRVCLDRLKLLMVSRLSIILVLVALSMAIAVSVLDHLGLTPSARAVLLPMVILTMIIERFYVRSEEEGFACALKLLGCTFFVAFCCFMLFQRKGLGNLVLTFPEAQFLVMALLILIGRYSGYRLTELWKFRDVSPSQYEGNQE